MHIVKANDDGNCLFNAIATSILIHKRQLESKKVKTLSKILRKIGVSVMKQKIQNNNIQFIYSAASEMNNIKNIKLMALNYVKKMSKSCEWGGPLEIMALSSFVHSLGFKGIQVYYENKKKIPEMRSNMIKGNKPLIRLILHGANNNGGTGYHFNTLFTDEEYKKLKKKTLSSLPK